MATAADGAVLRNRELFVESCRLMRKLPVVTVVRGDKDEEAPGFRGLRNQWKGLPTNFFASMENLRKAHVLLLELGAVPLDENREMVPHDEPNDDVVIVEVCRGLLAQDMLFILDDAITSGCFMQNIDNLRVRIEYERNVADWAHDEVHAFQQRFMAIVLTVPSPVHSEYMGRPEAIAGLEQAARQMDALHSTLEHIAARFGDRDHSHLIEHAERDEVLKSATTARDTALAARTICWPMKMGIPNSTIVQLINEAILLRRTVIMGDFLATFLLTQFEAVISSEDVSFIRLLGFTPPQRPQAGAELLMYVLLWTPAHADYATKIEQTLLKPSDAAWIRVMSMITHKVSFAAASEESHPFRKAESQSTTDTAFKRPGDLSSDTLQEVRRLWAIAEVRVHELPNVTTKDMIEQLHENAAKMAEWGSAEAIRARESEARANERARKDELKLMQVTNGGELTDEAKARYRIEETYRKQHVTSKRIMKEAEVLAAKARLEASQADVLAVEQQLALVNAKMEQSLDSMNSLVEKKSGTVGRQVTYRAEQELRHAFRRSCTALVDIVHATSLKAAQVKRQEKSGKDDSDEPGDIGGEGVVAVLIRPTCFPRKHERGAHYATFRVGPDANFKKLKDLACVYANQPNSTEFELYNPVEKGVWFEHAIVLEQLKSRNDQQAPVLGLQKSRKDQHHLVVLRERKKRGGEYVRVNTIGGTPEIADIRSARISELTLAQLEEREQMIYEEKKAQSIEYVKELVQVRGPRQTHSQRVLGVIMHLLLLCAYFAYSYNRYSASANDATLVARAAKFSIETIPTNNLPVDTITDIYRAPLNSVGYWLATVFSDNLLRPVWYNGVVPNISLIAPPSFTTDFDENVGWTGLVLTQIRSRPVNCSFEVYAAIPDAECFGDDTDDDHYDERWLPYTGSSTVEGFTYTREEDAPGRPVMSDGVGAQSYGPGGYIRHIPSAYGIVPAIAELLENKWIDGHTRALIISANLNNRAFDLFASLQVLFEFKTTGYVHTTVSVDVLPASESSISAGFEALRFFVIGIYCLMVALSVQKLRFHMTYHSWKTVVNAFCSVSWISVITTLLLIAEVIFRSLLDTEMSKLLESGAAGLAAIRENRQYLESLNNASQAEAFFESAELIAFQGIDFRYGSWLYLMARSFTGIGLFCLSFKSGLAVVQYSSTWYLFIYYLFTAGFSALAAVSIACFSYLFGLAIFGHSLLGVSSPEFASVYKSFCSMVQLIVAPNRFYEDSNPFQFSDFSPEADGSKADLPPLPLLLLFEVSIMVIIWSLFVSIFMEAFSASTARIREEQRLMNAVRKLGVHDSGSGSSLIRTLHGICIEAFAAVQDVAVIFTGFIVQAREYERLHRLQILRGEEEEEPQSHSLDYERKVKKFRRALARMQLRVEEAEQIILLEHRFTADRYEQTVRQKLRTFGFEAKKRPEESTNNTALTQTKADLEAGVTECFDDRNGLTQAEPEQVEVLAGLDAFSVRHGGSMLDYRPSNPQLTSLIENEITESLAHFTDSEAESPRLRACCSHDASEQSTSASRRRRRPRHLAPQTTDSVEPSLADELYSDLNAQPDIASPASVKHSLLKQEETKSDSISWLQPLSATSNGQTRARSTRGGRLTKSSIGSTVFDPEQVRNKLQHRLPDDLDGPAQPSPSHHSAQPKNLASVMRQLSRGRIRSS